MDSGYKRSEKKRRRYAGVYSIKKRSVIFELAAWDVALLQRKTKKRTFWFNGRYEHARIFKLDNVLNGMFHVVNKFIRHYLYRG